MIRTEGQGIIHDASVTLEVLSVSLLLGDANGGSYVSSLDLTNVERIIIGLDAGAPLPSHTSAVRLPTQLEEW